MKELKKVQNEIKQLKHQKKESIISLAKDIYTLMNIEPVYGSSKNQKRMNYERVL